MLLRVSDSEQSNPPLVGRWTIDRRSWKMQTERFIIYEMVDSDSVALCFIHAVPLPYPLPSSPKWDMLYRVKIKAFLSHFGGGARRAEGVAGKIVKIWVEI